MIDPLIYLCISSLWKKVDWYYQHKKYSQKNTLQCETRHNHTFKVNIKKAILKLKTNLKIDI